MRTYIHRDHPGLADLSQHLHLARYMGRIRKYAIELG